MLSQDNTTNCCSFELYHGRNNGIRKTSNLVLIKLGYKIMNEIYLYQQCILQNGFYKDFGYGFYCTSLEKQAKRWAMARHGATIINKYQYELNENLKMLSSSKMSEEWLDFFLVGVEKNLTLPQLKHWDSCFNHYCLANTLRYC